MINIGFVNNYFDVYGNISRNVCMYMMNENCKSSKTLFTVHPESIHSIL